MKLNTKEFCVESARTLSDAFHMNTASKLNMLHGAIGLVTEVAELQNAVNVQGEIKDRVNFLEELGDADWYVAIFYRELFLPTDKEVTSNRNSSHVLELMRELSVASAELLDLFKKYSFYGREVNSEVLSQMIFNIEDILSELAKRAGSGLEEARFVVINKLRVRYPEKFTAANAENRDLEAERLELDKV